MTPVRRALVGVGPVLLSAIFLIRAVRPVPDTLLLSIFAVLFLAVAAMIAGRRIGAAVVLALGLALFQPITARDFAFSLGSVDSTAWRWWAIVGVIALGMTLVSSVVIALGRTDSASILGGSVAGVALGFALLLVFPALSAQPNFGGDLTAAELDALPVIELLNYRYEPPVVSVAPDGMLRAKLDNPSDLPHTVTIDELDLEVYVPAGRWSVIEIDGQELAATRYELYCSIGDHRPLGMQALLEIG